MTRQRRTTIFVLVVIFSLMTLSHKFVAGPIVSQSFLPHSYHAQLTGKNAVSDTTPFDVNGTDLGIIVKHNNYYHYIFGDTFGCGSYMGYNWRSNTMAYSEDTDPSDGISLKGWIINPTTGYAKELISSLKIDYVEMTCIPTTAVSCDGKLYIYYMSVNHWHATGGMWDCNNASIAVSTDNGQTFNKMSNISWSGNSHFIQFGFVQDTRLSPTDDYLYFLATPSGRFGACYLCRVPSSEILDQQAYEYYLGLDGQQNPTWTSDYTQAVKIFNAPVGELAVMWNAYLQKWTIFYMDSVNLALMIRTATNLWGPWSDPYKITDATQYPSLYGSFIHPDLVENNGQIVYFIMSVFWVYNTFVMSVDLSSLQLSITPSNPSNTNTSNSLGMNAVVLFVGFNTMIAIVIMKKHREKH